MLLVNDFFCGGGGLGLGFKQAGWEVAGAWDFNKYAVGTYYANVDKKVCLADITTLTGYEIPYANCWTFGSPCQDISNAGEKKGLIEGKRSSKIFEIMRLLDEVPVQNKPELIMAENVKTLKKWLPVLKEEYAKAGYIMYVKMFNSKYWGVPQNRERYFLVGVRQDLDKGYFKFPKEQTDFVPKLQTVLEDNVPEKYYLKAEKSAKIIELAMTRYENPQDAYTDKDGCALACNARYYKGPSYADVLKKRNTQIVEGIHYCNNYAKFTDIAGTCIARGPSRGMGNNTPVTGVVEPHPFRVRRLTPREYARLQGFPDSFNFPVSDTRIYEITGNAVTVTVANALAHALENHLKELGVCPIKEKVC